MSDSKPDCAQCPFNIADRICRSEKGRGPKSCPTINRGDILDKSQREYQKQDIREFARTCSIQEAEGYGDRELGYEYVRPIKPRILEIVEFAKRMNFKRLGLAFCVGLREEAKIVDSFFKDKGFEMVSVICKAGRVPKESLGIEDHQKIAIGHFESMCNPIFQAMILNSEETELNVLLGLCVGHDSLFLKYSKAPCTILAVKDRLLGHNPLAAIYNLKSYYRFLKR